jgi:hypothetical protein
VDLAREISQLGALAMPAIAAAPRRDPALECRRAAEQLLAACAPQPALARAWIRMPPVASPAPFPDLASALAAILQDPAGIVALTVCRSYPHAKIIVLGGGPRRFGFRSIADARRGHFAVGGVRLYVVITAEALRGYARTLAG